MDVNLIAAISISTLLLNVAASIYVARRDEFEGGLKTIQILLIWAVPVLGAISIIAIVMYLTRSISHPIRRDFGGGVQDSGFSE